MTRPRFRRLLTWALAAVCIATAGTLTFLWVRHQPRFRLDGGFKFRAISSDGAQVVTHRFERDDPVKCPLQIWDTMSGRAIASFGEDKQVERLAASDDGRLIVCAHSPREVRLIDWEQSRERIVSLGKLEKIEVLWPSPAGEWLVATDGRAGIVMATSTGRVSVVPAVTDIEFIDKDRFLCRLQEKDDHWQMIDAATGQVVAGSAFRAPGVYIASHGKLLALWKWHWQIGDSVVEVRDASTFAELFRIDCRDDLKFVARAEADKRRFRRFMEFSPDGSRLATWLDSMPGPTPLDVVDTATGKRVFSRPSSHVVSGSFSGDGALFALQYGEHQPMLTMLDAPSGTPLWEEPQADWDPVTWAGSTGLLLHRDSKRGLRFRDARTGTTLATLPFWHPEMRLLPKPDHRHFVIDHWRLGSGNGPLWALVEPWLPDWFDFRKPGCLVVETASQRELFRIGGRGSLGSQLSDDGQTLVTIDADEARGTELICVWEVSSARAWTWSLGAMLATGGVLAMWAWLRGRRRSAASAA